MITKKVTYVDFLGQEREEEFYFNLKHDEIIEMNFGAEGQVGLEFYINRISNERDPQKLYDLFKAIILKAYGEIDEGGRRFVKDPTRTKAFSETQAFSDIIVEFLSDETAEKFLAFVKGIMPKEPQDHKQASQ